MNGAKQTLLGLSKRGTSPHIDFGFGIRAGRRPPSSAAYLKLCVALPALHSSALHLLSMMLAIGGATLYPMLGAMGRLLGGLMRQTVAAGPRAFLETPPQVPHCRSCAQALEYCPWC